MKKEQISDSLNMLDDDILEETDRIRNKQNGKWKQVKGWKRWTAVAAAACLALTGYTGIRIFSGQMSNWPFTAGGELDSGGGNSDGYRDLPLLTVTGEYGVMGYEGYMAYDISDLINENPWQESGEPSVLPVYQNPVVYDDDYIIVSGADFDKMREFLLEIAGRLGLDTNSLVITDDAPDEEEKQIIIEKLQSVGDTVPDGYFDPTMLIAETENLKLQVDRSMTATVSFQPAVQLPEEYHFTHHSSYEEMNETARYLENEYSSLIDMEAPRQNIYGGDYNIYEQQSYHIEIFDMSGEDVDRIINYNFNRVAFYCNDDGMLYMVRIFQPDLSQKAGDYPVITADEAKALLLNGNYITSVPYEVQSEEYVKKVELVYRTGRMETFFMPYYRFYVEIPEAARGELKDYGAYYVPAVESSYIANMPVWDGSFNW